MLISAFTILQPKLPVGRTNNTASEAHVQLESGGSNQDNSSLDASSAESNASFYQALSAAEEAWDLYENSNDLSALSDCVTHSKVALEHGPKDDPERHIILDRLGLALHRRFKRMDKLVDLEESIEYHKAGLSMCPVGHQGREYALNNLGLALCTRFSQTGNPADVDNSIQYHEEHLSICPIEHPNRSYALSSLGSVLYMRFTLTGNTTDLEDSIRYQEEKLSICPTGHSGRSSALTNLSQSLLMRFGRTGNFADLDNSIQYLEESLSISPIGHEHRLPALTNLGAALYTRFEQTRNSADLDDSIRYQEELLSIYPIGHSGRSHALNNLSIALLMRIERTRSSADLDASICYLEEQLSICPTGHEGRLPALNDLGSALYIRFEQTRNLADLEKSIQHQVEKLSHCPTGHSGRPHALTNLGRALLMRFKDTEDFADLDNSIRCQEESLSICPIGHSVRFPALGNLSQALQTLFERTRDEADIEKSISCIKAAANYSVSPLSGRLMASTDWISVARKYDTSSLAEAYSTSLYLLNRLVLLASNIHDRHTRLTSTTTTSVGGREIAVEAASHAIETGHLQSAVEVLEQGRGLMFNQLGNYRTPLDDLEAKNKELADRFRELSAAMKKSTLSHGAGQKRIVEGEDQIVRIPISYQRLSNAWDRTVEEIRQEEGFSSFLRATPFATLQRAAIAGPVIIVNISRYRSDAIIVQATGEPLLIPLPRATPSAVAALAAILVETTRNRPEAAECDRILEDLLREIWRIVVDPVVSQLTDVLELKKGSRICWVPTSTLWSLPLHAAGSYLPGEQNLPDLFVSSYAPTMSTLLRAHTGYEPNKNPSGPRWLVVAQPEAEGEPELPYATLDVDVIRHIGTHATVVEGEGCTRDAVLDGLKDTAWVHFACHGTQNLTDPFQSHFSLLTRDAPLTVLDILKTGLPQAELAVLSACHSAAGDR
ncbi:hypothetical protein FRB97_003215, partial [Tulasnella sp. 331]